MVYKPQHKSQLKIGYQALNSDLLSDFFDSLRFMHTMHYASRSVPFLKPHYFRFILLHLTSHPFTRPAVSTKKLKSY